MTQNDFSYARRIFDGVAVATSSVITLENPTQQMENQASHMAGYLLFDVLGTEVNYEDGDYGGRKGNEDCGY